VAATVSVATISSGFNCWAASLGIREAAGEADASCHVLAFFDWQKEISPLENAIETMEQSNSDLRRIVLQYDKNPELPLNPFSMKLNGTVDPRVMGGFSNYEKVRLLYTWP